MRLLDRYLLRELLAPFGYCLSGFLIFWISFDLFSEIDDYQKLNLGFRDIMEYYLVRTPELLVFLLPIALLLALLYALTNHARHNELTAMRSAGVSLARLSLPYLIVGLVLSLSLFALNELGVPYSAEVAEKILTRRLSNPSGVAARQWEHGVGFNNSRDNRRWLIVAYNLMTHEMIEPHVEWILPDGKRREITAERGDYRDGLWAFTNVQERVYPPGRGELPTIYETNLMVMAEFSETPDEIKTEIKVSKISGFRQIKRAQLTIREILDYTKLHREDPTKSALVATKLHGRLAAAWTCLVVVLIAVPFGVASGRRNAFVGVASSIFICFTYFVLQQFGLAMGTSGYVWPWAAAWAPNVLFALGGLLLAYRVR